MLTACLFKRVHLVLTCCWTFDRRVVFSPWLIWEGLSLLSNLTISMAKVSQIWNLFSSVIRGRIGNLFVVVVCPCQIPQELIAIGDEARIMMIRTQIMLARQAVFNGILRIIFVILVILRVSFKQITSANYALSSLSYLNVVPVTVGWSDHIFMVGSGHSDMDLLRWLGTVRMLGLLSC